MPLIGLDPAGHIEGCATCRRAQRAEDMCAQALAHVEQDYPAGESCPSGTTPRPSRTDSPKKTSNSPSSPGSRGLEHLFGQDFGLGTDIQTGPNGNLFVVSLTNGAIYEIFREEQP